mgnify:CR=1 FL=1
MGEINILFLSAGRRVELIKAFRKAMESSNTIGKLIAVDLVETAPALYFADEHLRIKRVLEEGYVDELIDICKNKSINLIIPTIDTELKVLSENKERIEKETSAQIMVSDKEAISIMRDKYKTYEFLKKNGFNVPIVISDKDIENKNYKFPLFIKPFDGSSSINNFKVENEEELNFFRKYVSKPIIQEFIQGQEYCVDIFTDFDGNPITIVPKKRVAAREGEIMKAEIVKDRRIIDTMKKLVEVIKPKGEINVDCMVNDKEINIIEINGRFAGGSPISFEAGANSPLNLLKILNGETLSYNEDYQNGMLAFRFDDCIYLK